MNSGGSGRTEMGEVVLKRAASKELPRMLNV
jgi:hypothetical protein